MANHQHPGDTTRKGYGAAHQRLRKRWAGLVREGAVLCPRCGEVIRPNEPWDLGHVDGTDKALYQGPEHRRCNRSAGAQKRNGSTSSVDPSPTPRTAW